MTLFNPLEAGDPRPDPGMGHLQAVAEHTGLGIDKWNISAIVPWMYGVGPRDRREWVRETIAADHAGKPRRPIRFHPDTPGIIP